MIGLNRQRLNGLAAGLRPAQMLRDIAQHRTTLVAQGDAMKGAVQAGFQQARNTVVALDRVRESVGYKATLGRGYAVVRADGAVASNVAAVTGAQHISVELHDGVVDLGSSPTPPTKAKPKKPKPTPPEQGQLF